MIPNGGVVDNADVLNLRSRLLGAHHERPPGPRAAKHDNEFSPSDANCHVTSRRVPMARPYHPSIPRSSLLRRSVGISGCPANRSTPSANTFTLNDRKVGSTCAAVQSPVFKLRLCSMTLR